ncbi:MAG: hypothetical protein ACT4PP_07455 [Sporichthyaceae bacterium]
MPRRRVATMLLAPLAGALALSACGPDQLGAAAVVDGQRITISQVQDTLREVRELRERFDLDGDLPPEAARLEVERRVLDLVFERAARELGLRVTEGDVAAARAEERRSAAEIAELAAQNNISLDSLDELYRRLTVEAKIGDRLAAQNPGLAQEELGQVIGQALVATAMKMDIRINPRYGTFSVTEGSISPFVFDFLASPAPNDAQELPAPQPQ